MIVLNKPENFTSIKLNATNNRRVKKHHFKFYAILPFLIIALIIEIEAVI